MTIYQERANGRNEYWTYSEGRRIYLSAASATKELNRGARLVRA
jgi:hypothetical protein